MHVHISTIPAAVFPILWTCLGVIGVLGLLALVSPRHFAAIARHGGRWVDTSKVLDKLDARVDIDERILRHSRLLGVAVVASVALLTSVIARY